MLVIAMGLLVQPVLTAIGELHELTAHTAQAASHADVHQAEPGTSLKSGSDEGEMPHKLLHHAHCCGSQSAFETVSVSGLFWDFRPIQQPGRLLAVPASSVSSGSPYRPPIAA